ncbi:serine protease grass-like [Drosophila kikkawai]|uniref:Serine protease grass-like n=1 Tax=Drosophila kikkawai TaxID=30033 RepID=A0A6P4HM87_DROKI
MKGLRLLFLAFCLIVCWEFGLANPSGNRIEEEPVEYCTTFEEKPGRIIHVTKCAYMMDIVAKIKAKRQLTPREQNITLYSRRENFKKAVCCEDLVNDSGLELLKQSEQECGDYSQDLVSNGIEVEMGTRPWMALLEYDDPMFRFQCGATLITPRYILTAAHCINDDMISVRLGEHRISSDKDCRAFGSQVLCMPSPQDIGIEKTIVHANFNKEKIIYDIALIRLERPAEITRNVKTICLPLYEDVQGSILGRSVQLVTGWGIYNNRDYSDVPIEAPISRLHPSECRTGRHVVLLENQLCFNSSGKDSCRGDSGGPLSFPYIYKGLQRFVQMGIVSYGPQECGSEGTAVYTDVMWFLPWITQNIES